MGREPKVALATAVRWKNSRLLTLKVVRTKAYARMVMATCFIRRMVAAHSTGYICGC